MSKKGDDVTTLCKIQGAPPKEMSVTTYIIVLNYTHIKSNIIAIVILHSLFLFKLNLIDK